jgi:phospholipid:diacylglycerol acyltransferase
MALLSYDWRLAPLNLEVRDRYFSRMKVMIEHSKLIGGKKTVLVSHSMGGNIVLFFLKLSLLSDLSSSLYSSSQY